MMIKKIKMTINMVWILRFRYGNSGYGHINYYFIHSAYLQCIMKHDCIV